MFRFVSHLKKTITSSIIVIGCDKFQSVLNSFSFLSNNYIISSSTSLDELNIELDIDQKYIFIYDVGDIASDVKQKIENLLQIHVDFAIIASSQSGSIPIAVAAMKAGAVEYLHLPFSSPDLEEAVFYADALLTERARGPAAADVRARFEALSPRERIVAEGIVAGKQNKRIASELGLSVRTIEMYRANLMKKIGARSVNDILRLSFSQY